MGMIGNYLRVTQNELDSYLNDCELLENRIYNDEDLSDNNLFDIDKCWEAVFFMLTGKNLDSVKQAPIPLQWILQPPQIINPEQDMGYGPAMYTTVNQTGELCKALNQISEIEFRSRYNGKLMCEMDIYPGVWEDNENLEYLTDYFNDLKDFYNQTSAQHQAVIFFIN